MEIKTNGDYNRCQLNETINLSPDGKILSRSLMLNLRGESAQEVFRAYQELKKLTTGGNEESQGRKISNGGSKQNGQKARKEESCPECGSQLLEKQGISSKNGKPYHFFGCSSFPACNFTLPVERVFGSPDEDLAVSEIPF